MKNKAFAIPTKSGRDDAARSGLDDQPTPHPQPTGAPEAKRNAIHSVNKRKSNAANARHRD